MNQETRQLEDLRRFRENQLDAIHNRVLKDCVQQSTYFDV